MGDYTRIGLVRSATGFGVENTPSGTTAMCIRWGEGALKKYLGVTPASDAVSMADTNVWVETAATAFAAYFLALRHANQNMPNTVYQRQTQMDRGSRFSGYVISAEMWWNTATRECDLHGRDIIIQIVEP